MAPRLTLPLKCTSFPRASFFITVLTIFPFSVASYWCSIPAKPWLSIPVNPMTPEANPRFGKNRLSSDIKFTPEGESLLNRTVSSGETLRLIQTKLRLEFIFLKINFSSIFKAFANNRAVFFLSLISCGVTYTDSTLMLAANSFIFRSYIKPRP